MFDKKGTTLNLTQIFSRRSNLLRSFQGHDPEALWNLLNISRHLYAKGDRNASHLLHLITEECLLSYQMMFYWMLSYNSSSNHHAATGRGRPGKSKFQDFMNHYPYGMGGGLLKINQVQVSSCFTIYSVGP